MAYRYSRSRRRMSRRRSSVRYQTRPRRGGYRMY